MTLTFIYLFSIIGLFDTLYLIYHGLNGTDVACLFFPKEWCQKVQYSPQSKTFGIPNSIAGFVMYTFILLLAWLYSGGFAPLWPLQFIITFGFLFSFYFLYVQGFVLKAFCTWCVVSAVNFFVMFVSIWFLF